MQLEWNLTCTRHRTSSISKKKKEKKKSLSLCAAFTVLAGSCRVSLEESKMEAEHVTSQTAQPQSSCLLTFFTIQSGYKSSCFKADRILLSIYESILITLCLVNKAKMKGVFFFQDKCLFGHLSDITANLFPDRKRYNRDNEPPGSNSG